MQYNFIYEALTEEVKLGQTSFSKEEFLKFYKNLKEDGPERCHLFHQHQVLIIFLVKFSHFLSWSENIIFNHVNISHLSTFTSLICLYFRF